MYPSWFFCQMATLGISLNFLICGRFTNIEIWKSSSQQEIFANIKTENRHPNKENNENYLENRHPNKENNEKLYMT